MIMFRNEQKSELRVELYYILSHLVLRGDKPLTYRLALEENLLEQCSVDLDMMDQEMCVVVLNLIDKLVTLGEEYVCEEESINPFSQYIQENHLKAQIISSTYCYNEEISRISSNILDNIDKGDNDFGII